MDLLEHKQGDIVVVCPSGRIDHSNAAAFQQALQPYIDDCEAHQGVLVLDLSGLEYMSSVGLRVLVVAAKQIEGTQATVVVCALQPVMQEIFSISRFDLIFDVYETREAAVGALA